MPISKEVLKAVLNEPYQELRVQKSATVFRVMSEDIIADIENGKFTTKAHKGYKSFAYPVDGREDVLEDGVTAIIYKGESFGEFFASLSIHENLKSSKTLIGGFSLFYNKHTKVLLKMLGK